MEVRNQGVMRHQRLKNSWITGLAIRTKSNRKKKIITTELVARTDFFHHLP